MEHDPYFYCEPAITVCRLCRSRLALHDSSSHTQVLQKVGDAIRLAPPIFPPEEEEGDYEEDYEEGGEEEGDGWVPTTNGS